MRDARSTLAVSAAALDRSRLGPRRQCNLYDGKDFDVALTDRPIQARDMQELSGSAAPKALAQITSSAHIGIALRARAGIPLAALDKLAEHTIDLVCGPKSELRP